MNEEETIIKKAQELVQKINKRKDFETPEIDKEESELLKFVKEAKKQIKVLLLSSVVPNIYVLCFFSTLSKFLGKIFENAPDADIEINFLMMRDIIKYADFIKVPFREHHECIIPDFEKKMDSVKEMKTPEFESLVKNVLVNLMLKRESKIKLKKLILSGVRCPDISDYRREKEEAKLDEDRIENQIRNFEEEYEKLPEQPKVLFNEEQRDNEGYNMVEELLKIIVYSLKKGEKIILICGSPLKNYIDGFLEKHYEGLKDNLKMLSYSPPPPRNQKELPFYISIISGYLNEKEKIVDAIDEYFNCKVLTDLNSKLFKFESIEHICKENIGDYNLNRGGWLKEKLESWKKESVEAKKRRLISEIEEEVKKIEEYEKERAKDQKAEIKIINEGFLSIQDGVVSQLEFIL